MQAQQQKQEDDHHRKHNSPDVMKYRSGPGEKDTQTNYHKKNLRINTENDEKEAGRVQANGKYQPTDTNNKDKVVEKQATRKEK